MPLSLERSTKCVCFDLVSFLCFYKFYYNYISIIFNKSRQIFHFLLDPFIFDQIVKTVFSNSSNYSEKFYQNKEKIKIKK